MIACLLPAAPVDPSLLLPLLTGFSPAVEPAGAAFFLDLGHLANHRPADLLDQINQTVDPALPQPPYLGLAVGKFPAQLAAASLGAGRGLVIVPGCKADFLRPLPINLLPLDEELARQFQLLGLRTLLGQLADLPTGAVLNRFGRQGRHLQQLARGQDERPVRPNHPPLTELLKRQFDPPLTNRLQLDQALQQLLPSLTARLRAHHRLCQTVYLALRWVDPPAVSLTVTLSQPTNRPERLQVALQARLSQTALPPGIEEVSLTLADLLPAQGEQPHLFGPSLAEAQIRRLRRQLPQLLTRFGPGRLFTVELTRPEAYLPEQRFQLHDMEEE